MPSVGHDPGRAPLPPERPFLVLGLGLALAAGLGASALPVPVALGLLLLAAWLAGRSGLGRPAAWCLVATLTVFAGARRALPPRPQGWTAEVAARPALCGIWRGEGRGAGRGWIDGREQGGRRPVPLFCELAGGTPRVGEGVFAFPPLDRRPWVRGPVAPTDSGSGLVSRFEGRWLALPDELVRLEPAPAGLLPRPLARALEGLRAALVARCSERFGAPSAGLLRALLLGDRSELEPRTLDLFTRTGTRHLLAVSGLHVALVAVLLLGPLIDGLARALRMLGAGSIAGILLPLSRPALLLLYVPLAGNSAPVSRAALALSLAFLAPVFSSRYERRADALTLWGLALALEILADCRAPLQPGVQLSYLATLGILAGTRPLERALRAATPGGGRIAAVDDLGHGRWPWLRVPMNLALGWLVRGLAASCAAVLATLPVTWSTFGELAPIGVVLTPLLIAPLAWLLGVGWLALALPLPSVLLDLPAQAIPALLRLADGLPATPETLPPRPALLVLMAVALLFGGLAARGPIRAGPARRGGLFVLGLLLLPWTRGATGLELHLLDVGHGTAAVFRAPGEDCWIFDAGSRDRRYLGSHALGPLLRSWEVQRVDVVVSHGDRDHSSALPWLLERFPPRSWAGALNPEIEVRLPSDCRVLDLERGRALLGSPGPLQLELARGLPLPGNEGSRCLALEWQGRRSVLCGDAEQEGLWALLELGLFDGPLELLLFPHHGSDTPAIGPLLARSRPQTVWVSAPREPRLAGEFVRRGLNWHLTGGNGPLVHRPEAPARRANPHGTTSRTTHAEDTLQAAPTPSAREFPTRSPISGRPPRTTPDPGQD